MSAVVCAVGLAAAPAFADEAAEADRMWPALPEYHQLSLSDEVTDNLSDLGNRYIAHNLEVLSHDVLDLHVDGRGQRARLRVGGGNAHYLSFHVDSDWHFTDGQAHVKARLELAVAGHEVDVKLPEMDVIPDSYHGQQLVQINVPLLQRKF